MSEIGWETEQFQRHRPHLEAVAYRMLGSVSEAEDALQEAWLRLSRSRQETIHNARAWLTTIVGRVCIDMLRARQSRREDYVGAWVPEPIVEAGEQANPEQHVLLAETVGLALLVVLETLTPTERVAYVLHDMFALPFAQIGEIIDRSPEATRQLASRARRQVHGATPQPDADLAKQREAVDAFLAASRAGDFDALVAILHPDVMLRASGARKFQQELTGAAEVAGRLATFGPRFATLCHPAMVNGQPGVHIKTGQGSVGAIGFTISGDLIKTIDVTLDPDKLEDFEQLLGSAGGTRASVAQRIINEALSWPGVHSGTGHMGSIELRAGRRELGHLHGDTVVDIPLPPELQGQAVQEGVALQREPGWVAVPLDTEEGMQRALALLRGNYERGRAKKSRARPRAPGG
ncbi:MAG TPA: RNA polymerase sigma factor SigJ [Solirubrobacteraceae bacterium]|nr:RNA polymerase sigma factor SigJ [Solirubrobacteraceae bacterium]